LRHFRRQIAGDLDRRVELELVLDVAAALTDLGALALGQL